MLKLHPSEIKEIILQGGVIAYPTEAVYGLGCDPDNDIAIQKVLDVKQRPWQKGLILVASDFQQLLPYIDDAKLTPEQLAFAFSKWPGPFTFVMPVKSTVSKLLCGDFDAIAVSARRRETFAASRYFVPTPLRFPFSMARAPRGARDPASGTDAS